MSYLCQKYKKVGVTDFLSEIKSAENYPNFEKLACIVKHDIQGL